MLEYAHWNTGNSFTMSKKCNKVPTTIPTTYSGDLFLLEQFLNGA